jgi:hypothetical protein
MRTKVLMVALSALVILAAPGRAQYDEHVDEGDPWDISDVHGDHDNGFCDNISGATGARDVDCLQRGPNGPREWRTSCEPGPFTAGLECGASATVYCPGLGFGNYPGKDYINFSCWSDTKTEVRSGILDGFGGFPQKKGVICRNGYTGDVSTCGCIQSNTSSSSFFGSKTNAPPGSNYYICN